MNPVSKKHINKLIDKYIDQIIKLRHNIHQHPEIGHREFKTCELIRNKLSELNINILPPFLKTDTVAILNEQMRNKNVTLRADIDALPLCENTNLPYASSTPKMMHACGHDGHTAILLGTAMVLNELKDELNGSVRFVFQPAEECAAGGKDLVDAGVIDTPKADVVFALHGNPGDKTGLISYRSGVLSSACAEIKITIKGKGGHGSCPEKSIDPILIAAKVIDSLYHIPSRSIEALESVVISICQIQSGSFSNIIPDTATMSGTIRFFNMDIESEIKTLLHRVIKSICDMYGATFNLEYKCDYIPMVNDKNVTAFCNKIFPKYFDEHMIVSDVKPDSGSEDFSFFQERSPGFMFNLGLGENTSQLHSCTFDFNDDAIKDGILAFTALTLEYLS
ncbi:MAG: amidohydrolase [bacterium]|nr:amidohydrolase [bacterium]